MLHFIWRPASPKWWLFCVWLCLQKQRCDAVDYIHAPSDPLAVNAKTVLTLIKQKATWNEAAAICKAKFPGGTLAKIDSMEVTAIVKNLLSNAPEPAWIGLYWTKQAGRGRRLAWSDRTCTDLDTNLFGMFGVSEDQYDESKRCYYVNGDSGQWFKDMCRNTKYFLCQHLNLSASSCPVQYEVILATFYSVPVNGTNSRQCMASCASTQGCFLTWPGSNICLLGVIGDSGSTYINKRCIEGAVVLDAGSFSPNDDEEPKACVKTNMSSSSDSGSSRIDYVPLSGGNCDTVKSSTTSVVYQNQTITITSVQFVTTTDIRTTTTVSTLTTTTTRTAEFTTTMVYGLPCTHTELSIVPTTITETTLGIQACSTTYTSYRECSVQQSTFCPSVQTVTMEITKHTTPKDIETTLKTPLAEKFVGSECAETSTVVVPITVTENSVSIQPTTVTQVSYHDCRLHQSDAASSSCSNAQTITMETTVYMTSTLTDCDATPGQEMAPSSKTRHEFISNTLDGRFVTTTVTKFDCTLSTSGPAASIARGENTVKATTVPVPATVVTMATSRAVAVSISDSFAALNLSTTTYIYDVITSRESCDITMTSFVYATVKVTQNPQNNSSQTGIEGPGKPMSNSVTEQEIIDIQRSIVKELSVSKAYLSSSRRRLESIKDHRLTARIPGIFACVLLLCSFIMLIALDLPVLGKDIRNNIIQAQHKLRQKHSNTPINRNDNK